MNQCIVLIVIWTYNQYNAWITENRNQNGVRQEWLNLWLQENDTDNIFSNDSKILRILINIILPKKVPSKEYYNKKDLIKKWGQDKNNINKSTGDEKTSHSPNCQDIKPLTSFSLPQIQSSNHILYSSNQQTRTNSNYVESKLKLKDLSKKLFITAYAFISKRLR